MSRADDHNHRLFRTLAAARQEILGLRSELAQARAALMGLAGIELEALETELGIDSHHDVEIRRGGPRRPRGPKRPHKPTAPGHPHAPGAGHPGEPGHGHGNPHHDSEGHFTSPEGAVAPGSHPKSAKGKRPKSAKPKQPKAPRREKAKPIRGHMAAARREGKGKDARLIMADGSEAPKHVNATLVSPKWTDVKVSVDPKAEVLVTARDDKGRPKMVTSKSFDARAAGVKFNRVSDMIGQHDVIAHEIQTARKHDDHATREAADCAWLMQVQATRPGSDRDTKAKVKAYGATTLEARHVVETHGGVRLQFIGKEGVAHDHLVRDKGLADMLMERKRKAASEDARLFDTNDAAVRDFTASLDGGKFSPKDFRTSAATRLATEMVKADGARSKSEREHKKRVLHVATRVSALLGNRPKQALQSYIHPAVFEPWNP